MMNMFEVVSFMLEHCTTKMRQGRFKTEFIYFVFLPYYKFTQSWGKFKTSEDVRSNLEPILKVWYYFTRHYANYRYSRLLNFELCQLISCFLEIFRFLKHAEERRKVPNIKRFLKKLSYARYVKLAYKLKFELHFKRYRNIKGMTVKRIVIRKKYPKVVVVPRRATPINV